MGNYKIGGLKDRQKAFNDNWQMIRLTRKQWQYLIVFLSLLITTSFIAYRQSSFKVAPNTEISSVASRAKTEIVTKETGVLTIWWYEGYVEAEKTFLRKIVNDWEKTNNKKIKLVFMSEKLLLEELEKAVASGITPDITIDRTQLVTRLAWSGKLTDVSAIIKPIKNNFPDSVLKNSYQYNNVTNEKSYYAVPIQQEAIYLHYWRDLLKELGYSAKDIPQDGDEFWQFWTKVQQKLQSQQQEVFGLGFSTSPNSTDTFLFFEQVLEAYNVKILDSQGRLLVNRPKTREGITQALTWWTQLYQQKYIPPSSLLWENADNNSSFYNQIVAMVPNSTLSIPAVRADEKDVYFNRIGTVGYPRKPNGEPMNYVIRVRQALVFAERNLEDAKSFLSYLIQPDVLASYIEAAGGRFFPVNKANWDDPFWNNPDDPHLSTVRKMLTESPTRPHYFSDNPAYMEVFAENVWGRALHQILAEGKSPEEAADWAIARITQIFRKWQ